MLLHLLPLFISISQALHLPRDLATPATKDATILLSGTAPPPCSTCGSGSGSGSGSNSSPTLQAGTPSSGSYTDRAIISFTLPHPTSNLSVCTLFLPAFTQRTHDAVQVSILSALSSSWDPSSITAETAPPAGETLATAYVDKTSNLAPLDLTKGCQGHLDDQNRLSIYVHAEGGVMQFWGRGSGNPAILKIQETPAQ